MTASPDLQPPQRTPPYLTNLSPTTNLVYEVSTSPGLPPTAVIDFDVSSEDLGVPIVGFLLADFPGFAVPYNTPPLKRFNPGDIPLGHLGGEQARRHILPVELTLPSSPGCHSVTLILTHQLKFFSIEPEDLTDMAQATWWFFLDDGSTNMGPELQKCVKGQAASPDAGPTDGGVE